VITESSLNVIASCLFFLAIVHTFSVNAFKTLASHYPAGSFRENFFHILGEIEVVFGVWASIYIVCYSMVFTTEKAVAYLNTLSFSEPIFVFVIMCVAGTRPIIVNIKNLIFRISSVLPVHHALSVYFITLVLGPLLGSFITEPAAMTVTALILREVYFTKKVSDRFKYLTLALLFVHVSIGGVLTHFAAPPVIMVAKSFNWDLAYMFFNFGWRALIAIFINTTIVVFLLKKELQGLEIKVESRTRIERTSLKNWWVFLVHALFLVLMVSYHAYPNFIVPLFLLFLGWHRVSEEYQEPLKIREGLLVAYFLGGLVVLGGPQSWWLKPIIGHLNDYALFFVSFALTAVLDNAAITYLGSLVPDLLDVSKWYLVAGAVLGGGLTVIANAPNPAGYSILNDRFGKTGINPLYLFLAALGPSLVAVAIFLVRFN